MGECPWRYVRSVTPQEGVAYRVWYCGQFIGRVKFSCPGNGKYNFQPIHQEMYYGRPKESLLKASMALLDIATIPGGDDQWVS